MAMITQELRDYVRQQFDSGVSVDALRQTLLSSGWSAQDVDDVLYVMGHSVSSQGVAGTVPAVPDITSDQEPVAQPIQQTGYRRGLTIAAAIGVLVLLIGAGSAFAAYRFGLFSTSLSIASSAESATISATTTEVMAGIRILEGKGKSLLGVIPTPRTLQPVSATTSSTFSYKNLSLKVPWAGVKKKTQNNGLLYLTFANGRSLILMGPSEGAGTTTLATFTSASSTIKTNYDLEDATLDATPDQVASSTPWRHAAFTYSLLVLKEVQIVETPVYRFSTGIVRGFQFGDATTTTKVTIDLFDQQDNKYTLAIAGTQAEIDYILNSITTTSSTQIAPTISSATTKPIPAIPSSFSCQYDDGTNVGIIVALNAPRYFDVSTAKVTDNSSVGNAVLGKDLSKNLFCIKARKTSVDSIFFVGDGGSGPVLATIVVNPVAGRTYTVNATSTATTCAFMNLLLMTNDPTRAQSILATIAADPHVPQLAQLIASRSDYLNASTFSSLLTTTVTSVIQSIASTTKTM